MSEITDSMARNQAQSDDRLRSTLVMIAARMAARQGHFMPPSLLDSQFAALEPPGCDENPVAVGIEQPVQGIVESIAGVLRAPTRSSHSFRTKAGDVQ